MTPLANNIRKLRMSKGMKQQAFGLIVGKSAAVISNYERGVTKPNDKVIAYFAREAHVTIKAFTGRELTQGDFCTRRLELIPIKNWRNEEWKAKF